MKDFLAIVGGSALLVVGVGLIIAFYLGLREVLDKIRYNYQVKHRFDKPPTAECYCRECVRHNNESKECYKFDGWRTADNWFCWDASPHVKEMEDHDE